MRQGEKEGERDRERERKTERHLGPGITLKAGSQHLISSSYNRTPNISTTKIAPSPEDQVFNT
jgi:hypothetical protein